jgi:hypothetical protein
VPRDLPPHESWSAVVEIHGVKSVGDKRLETSLKHEVTASTQDLLKERIVNVMEQVRL